MVRQQRAGKRDRRIKIERYTTTRDAANEPVLGWVDLVTVWASKNDISDGERFRAMEVSSEISTRFTILYSAAVADVNPKDRIEFPIGSRVYFDIFSVKEIGRREGLEISASARSDGGE